MRAGLQHSRIMPHFPKLLSNAPFHLFSPRQTQHSSLAARLAAFSSSEWTQGSVDTLTACLMRYFLHCSLLLLLTALEDLRFKMGWSRPDQHLPQLYQQSAPAILPPRLLHHDHRIYVRQFHQTRCSRRPQLPQLRLRRPQPTSVAEGGYASPHYRTREDLEAIVQVEISGLTMMQRIMYI